MASIRERKATDPLTGRPIKKYNVQVRIKGHPDVTATFTKKADAQRWAAQTEADIRNGRHFKASQATKRTFGEMVDRYIEKVLPTKAGEDAQKPQLLWWKSQLGKYALSDVTPLMIADSRDMLAETKTRQGKTRAPATTVRYLAALSHCYTIAIKEWHWCDANPVKQVTKPKEPRGRVRYLSDDERRRLLDECRASSTPALMPIVSLLLYTGCRRDEIRCLQYHQIDWDRNALIIEKTKNGAIKRVSLVQPAADILRDWSRVRRLDTPYVFPGEKDPQQPISIDTGFKYAIRRAGIEDFRLHDLRHSTASYLAQAGVPVMVIAEILGHKTLAMVKRYSHLSETESRAALEKVAERLDR